MTREVNHRFIKNVCTINLHAIIIYFNLCHILNIDVNHVNI